MRSTIPAFMMLMLNEMVWKICLCSLLLTGVSALCSHGVWADPFRFDGNLNYLKLGGDQDNQTSLNDSYSLYFDKSLSAGMLFTGNMRYSNQTLSDGADTSFYSPSATLDLRNNLFSLNLNGTVTKREVQDLPDVDTSTWGITWFSLLEDWPKLRLQYNQSYYDNNRDSGGSDSVTNDYRLNLSHTIDSVSFLYDLRILDYKDSEANRENDSQRHQAQGQYQDSFWQDKLTISASGQYSYYNFKNRQKTTLGRLVFTPFPPALLGGAFAGNDNSPESGSLLEQNGLIDQDYLTGVIEILQASESANLGVRVAFNPVNRIDVVLSGTLSSDVSSQIEWTAYVSNDNFIWTQVPVDSVVYTDEVIDGAPLTVAQITLTTPGATPLKVDYVKVVADSPGAPTVIEEAYASEIEVGLATIGTGETQKTDYDQRQSTSSLSLGLYPSERWSFGYNFRFTESDSDPGIDSSTRNHSLSGTYAPWTSLSFTTNLSDYVNKTKGHQKQENVTFSLSMQGTPLDTLNYSLGYTHSESFTDGEKVQIYDSATLYSNAQIFPDLSSALTLNWLESEELVSSSTTRSWSARLDFNARLSARLNLETNLAYLRTRNNQQFDDGATSTERSYRAIATYRPSDLVLIRSEIFRNDLRDETFVNGYFSCRMTPVLQFSENLSVRFSDNDSLVSTTMMTWDVSSHFTFSSTYTYQSMESSDRYALLVGLSANF